MSPDAQDWRQRDRCKYEYSARNSLISVIVMRNVLVYTIKLQALKSEVHHGTKGDSREFDSRTQEMAET